MHQLYVLGISHIKSELPKHPDIITPVITQLSLLVFVDEHLGGLEKGFDSF
jgi:hypothetical protein